jgi:predicted mannosyl-3-phosphoglycerate phosphatase (HAD superfamily)
LADFHDGGPEMLLDLKLTLSFSIWEWDVANPIWRKAMKNGKERFETVSKRSAVIATLAVMMGGSGGLQLAAQSSAILVKPERQVATVHSKFYCNTKALTLEERARHKQLGEKLLAARKETVETEKGYEFQYSPNDVSLAELAEWVGAESKCCPFFDFHIDLEREGKLLCLRLTGEEGIKAFIHAELKMEK